MASFCYFIFLVAIFVRPVPSNRFENSFFPLTQSSAHEMEPQSQKGSRGLKMSGSQTPQATIATLLNVDSRKSHLTESRAAITFALSPHQRLFSNPKFAINFRKNIESFFSLSLREPGVFFNPQLKADESDFIQHSLGRKFRPLNDEPKGLPYHHVFSSSYQGLWSLYSSVLGHCYYQTVYVAMYTTP